MKTANTSVAVVIKYWIAADLHGMAFKNKWHQKPRTAIARLQIIQQQFISLDKHSKHKIN